MRPILYVDTTTEPIPVEGGVGPTPHLFDVDTVTRDVYGGSRPPGILPPRELPEAWRRLYTVTELLAESGQASVWLARDVSGGPDLVLRRALAVSALRHHRANVAQIKALDHPHLVKSLQPPIERDMYRWECLEFCARGSLAHHQRQLSDSMTPGSPLAPLPTDQIRDVVAAVAEALHYLHTTAQLLHTDVKPDNILQRSDGTFVLSDFDTAVNRHDPPSIEQTAPRTVQYAPGDAFLSTAWDWAQLGLTILTLHTGQRSPSHHFREIDYYRLDPDFSLLIRGLLIPEIGSGPQDVAGCLRWGHAEVMRWLNGDNPPLTGTDIAEAVTVGGRFLAYVASQPCHSPEQLGAAMGGPNWQESIRLIQGMVGKQPYLEWLADELKRSGDRRAAEVRSMAKARVGDPGQSLDKKTRVVHPDQHLARLITCLNPGGTPSYGLDAATSVEFTPTHLSRLAVEVDNELAQRRTDDPRVILLDRIHSLNMLDAFAGMHDFHWLRDIDANWHHAEREVLELLGHAASGASKARRAYQLRLRSAGQAEEQLLEFQTSEWESYGAAELPEFGKRVSAHLLRALLDPAYEAKLIEERDKLMASPAGQEAWFADILSRRIASSQSREQAPALAPEPPPAAGPWRQMIRGWWQAAVQVFRRRG